MILITYQGLIIFLIFLVADPVTQLMGPRLGIKIHGSDSDLSSLASSRATISTLGAGDMVSSRNVFPISINYEEFAVFVLILNRAEIPPR